MSSLAIESKEDEVTVKLATEKQVAFLTSLNQQMVEATERLEGQAKVDAEAVNAVLWNAIKETTVGHGPEFLTVKQASSFIDAFKAMVADLRAKAPVAPAVHAQPKPNFPALPDVAQGHYAVPSFTGNNDLDFYRVDRPTEGQWAGRTFVKRVIGGRPDAPVRGAEARAALERIAADPDAAARYGQTIGRCYVCNRHLTDETSRALGIGPECRKGMAA